MADMKPGSWLGDGVEEFKKLPAWGKILAGVVVVGVIGFIIYRIRQAQGTSANSAASGAVGLGIPSGASSGVASGTSSGSTAPGGIPTFPFGTQVGVDTNGNPTYGILPNPSPSPTGPTPPTGVPTGSPIATPTQNGIPLLPYDWFPNHQFTPGTKQLTYNGTTYNVQSGSQGRVWGTPVGGTGQILLYGASGAYGPPAAPTGPTATANSMANPQIYHQAAVPHISSAHPGGQ